MPRDKFKIPVAVYIIPTQKNKVLLSRRYNTGWMDGSYSLVAGHIDGRETITEAMLREAREEAGITLDPQDLTMAHVLHRNCPDIEYLDFFFTTSKWRGEIKIMEPDKCDDLSWFEKDKLPPNTLDYIRHVFDQIDKGITFSEFGWEQIT